MTRLTTMISMWAFCFGCLPTSGSDGGTPDGGGNDAGPDDAGQNDAGSVDAGAPDAGATDAGELPPSCSEAPGLYENADGTQSEVVEFRERNGFSSTKVIVRRRINGFGGGNTTDYSLERMRVETADVDVCIVEPLSLTYDWAHHNHDDYLIAVDGERTYQLHIGFETVPPYGWLVTFEIRATDGGAVTYGPIEMEQS